jgi:hypothetical protein
MAERQRWRPLLFDCPVTGQKVQGLIAEETCTAPGTPYESVTCLACSGVHLVDPVHGGVLGARWNKAK